MKRTTNGNHSSPISQRSLNLTSGKDSVPRDAESGEMPAADDETFFQRVRMAFQVSPSDELRIRIHDDAARIGLIRKRRWFWKRCLRCAAPFVAVVVVVFIARYQTRQPARPIVGQRDLDRLNAIFDLAGLYTPDSEEEWAALEDEAEIPTLDTLARRFDELSGGGAPAEFMAKEIR